MKKTALFILAALFSLQLASAKDVLSKDAEKLPLPAKEFISKYFPDEKISYIKIDEEFLSTSYEITFISGIEIEFMKDGAWKEIDCKHMPIPEGAIPQKILQYLKTNFPDAFITQIEKGKRKYDVELSNKLDLEFDKNENFIRMDD